MAVRLETYKDDTYVYHILSMRTSCFSRNMSRHWHIFGRSGTIQIFMEHGTIHCMQLVLFLFQAWNSTIDKVYIDG